MATKEELAANVAKLTEQLDSFVKKMVEAYPKEKPNFSQIIKFIYMATTEAVELAEYVTDEIPGLGSDKKAFVCEAIKQIYNKINPDIPWIVEPFESLVENLILNTLVPVLVDQVVAILNKHNVFAKGV